MKKILSIKNKTMFVGKKGFTLIEMLLVVAIIGILAGAVYVMIGDSSDAKTKSAISTMKSIMPYAQECQFKGNDLSTSPVPGNSICLNSETNWPEFGTSLTECGYSTGTANTWVAECAFKTPTTITCDARSGVCNW